MLLTTRLGLSIFPPMAQKQRDRMTCRICGKHRDEVGPMSNSGICEADSLDRAIANHVGLTTRSGPYWKLWRKSMAASVGGVLLDDDGT